MLFISICIVAISLILGMLLGQLKPKENWLVFTIAFFAFIFMGLSITSEFIVVDPSTGQKVLSAEGGLFAGSLNHASCLAFLLGFWLEGGQQEKRIDLSLWWLALLLGAGTALFSSFWLYILERIGIQHEQQSLVLLLNEGSQEIKIWGFVFAVLLAPICEELLFRKLLLTLLLERIEILGAIVFSGVLFGFMHVASPTSVPPLIIFGFLLGWLQVKYKNILLPIIAHIVNNFIAAAMSLF